MFDVDTGKWFSVGKLALDPYWWDYNNTLSIWASAVRQNLTTGLYFWAGSEVPLRVKNYNPVRCAGPSPAHL